jgi:ribosomal protein S18 acetylase RimI-like enzyme
MVAEEPEKEDGESSESEQANEFDEGETDDDELLAVRRKQAAARAALLAKRGGSKRVKEGKATSIGARRVGSATVSRQGVRATSKIMDALRKTAQGASSESGSDQKGTIPNNEGKEQPPPPASVSQSIIYSAIEDLLRKYDSPEATAVRNDAKFTAAFQVFGRTIGFLGEEIHSTLLVHGNSESSDEIAIRLATPADDRDIANLRLSVFSDFSKELQSQFCARSCQAISARRKRGATCVVATAPCRNMPVSGSRTSHILGSAECSFHEFFGTRLGHRRKQNSILYVTEVAVNPAVRRRGIASKLLQAIDILAEQRNIETLYLHVDAANDGALKLYEKAGYHKICSDDPMYLEFTTSLNLHPGATKGRDHFLLYKNLASEPTWLDDVVMKPHHTNIRTNELVGMFGFEIPA